MKKLLTLKARDIDPKFKYELSKRLGVEHITMCVQCGTCTADCPIARFDDFYRPRKLIRMTQLGLKDLLLSNDAIWLCSTCFTCIDRCPQDVGIASTVRALRNLSVLEGSMPSVFKELASTILKTGYAYKIPRSRLQRREEVALPSLPKTNVKNLANLFRITGLSNILETEGS